MNFALLTYIINLLSRRNIGEEIYVCKVEWYNCSAMQIKAVQFSLKGFQIGI